MLELLKDIDTSVFLFLNGIHSYTFDRIMWLASGRLIWLPLYLAILVFMVIRFGRSCYVLVPAAVILISLSDQGSVHLFKEVFERLRPCHEPALAGRIHLVAGYCGGPFGFVSSHAANTAALAMYTTLIFRNRYFGAGIFLWSLFVSYSRVYLGVHYPGDVLGGMALGVFLGWLMYRLGGFVLGKIPSLQKDKE